MRCPSSSIPPCIFSQLSLFDSLKSSSLSSENITCLFKFLFVHSPQFVPGHHDLICPLSPFSVLHSVRILLPSKTPVGLNQPLHQTGPHGSDDCCHVDQRSSMPSGIMPVVAR